MKKLLLRLTTVLSLFAGLGLFAAGCGNDCPGDEICAFQTFGKDGDFGEECVCVLPECNVDEDCDPGFICDDGLCVAP